MFFDSARPDDYGCLEAEDSAEYAPYYNENSSEYDDDESEDD